MIGAVELYEDTRGKKAREMVRQQVEANREKSCTFKPEVPEYRPPHSAAARSRSRDRSRYEQTALYLFEKKTYILLYIY